MFIDDTDWNEHRDTIDLNEINFPRATQNLE